jgi:MFS family permease
LSRFFAGLGVGIISVLVPLYQSEMAPKWIRGTLVCAYQLAITCGILVAGVVNIFTQSIDGPNAFRIPLSIQFVWAGVLFLGLALLPETPRYLIKQKQHHAAALSLSRLRRLDITHPALIEELAEIEANHAYELSLGPSTYKDIFLGSPHLGRRLLTGCALQMLQQLTGCVRVIPLPSSNVHRANFVWNRISSSTSELGYLFDAFTYTNTPKLFKLPCKETFTDALQN